MKICMIECTEEELRANRGIMDTVVDACRGLLSGFYGTYTPCYGKDDGVEPQESEDKDADSN